MKLKGKRALICGASAGIGRAGAFALARSGAEVILLARRVSRLLEIKAEIEKEGLTQVKIIAADLDRRDEVCSLINQELRNAPIQILVNNSGGPPGGPLLDADESDFLSAFSRHVLASHRLVQLLLPGMEESAYGRIINIVSTSVREPIPGLGVSNTIRGAMAGWSKSLSRELPPGVTINNVLPGYTDTERLSSLKKIRSQRTGVCEQSIHDDWLSQIPESRLGRPEEIAAAILFLASPEASYVRGISLPVDGGRMRSI